MRQTSFAAKLAHGPKGESSCIDAGDNPDEQIVVDALYCVEQ